MFEKNMPIKTGSLCVICFPFAGAGASFIKPWKADAGSFLEIYAVQMPGREQRFNEEPYRNVKQAIDAMLPEILGDVGEKRPLIVFGHSMGAILAYEFAKHLYKTINSNVALLIVSGSPAPWGQREQKATGLDDDAFITRVEEFAGYRHPALEDPEMRDLLLPILRSDIEMHENYAPDDQKKIPIPTIAVRGVRDELVSLRQIEEWSDVTSSSFYTKEFQGGHMYLVENHTELIDFIEQAARQQELEVSYATCG
jgi:surfactin synthase thioesterase subunit